MALLLGWPAVVFAQEIVSSGSRLDTLHVTATRITSPLPRTARHLQVLDTLQVRTAPRPEVSELLRTATLVDVRQRGPFDAQTDLGIRGGTFDQALVLVDGIPMTDPQTGHHLMNLPLLADALERIEVLYGGAARTFGAGAMTGAINLVTREPVGRQGSFQVEGGQYGSYLLRAVQDIGGPRGGLRITAFHGSSDGYVPNSDMDRTGGHLVGTHRMGRVKLKGQLGAVHRRFGAQNFYSSVYPDQQEIIGSYFGAIELRNDEALWAWNAKAYHRRHDDRFQLFRESDGYYRYADGYFIRGAADTARFTPTFFYTFHNRHRTDVTGAEANVKRRWKAGTTAFGAHARREHILSNVLGEPMDEPVEATGAREAFTRSDERHNLAVHLDHRVELGRWGVDAGLLLNVNDRFVPEWVPGVDLHYRWGQRHVTYASSGRAFRFPTWTDLYYNRGGAQGSKDLRTEHAVQMELGHRFTVDAWGVVLCVWRREGSDLIDWVSLPGGSVTRATNLTEVDLNGVELQVDRRTANGNGRGGVLYAYQWSDQQDFPFTSLYVLDHLEHNAVLWWQQRVADHWMFRSDLSWRTRNSTYVNFADGQRVEYPSPLRIDLRIDRTFGTVTLHVGCTNVLDAEQVDRGNVPLPGRWFTGGVCVEWRTKGRQGN
jgi:iron complex outermembrane receptor protein